MSSINFPLLKSLSETSGVSGFEKPIRDFIMQELSGLNFQLTIDNLGNLIVFKKGTGNSKLMLAAHMDEIGYIVNHIDDDGFIRFLPLGGFDPKTLTSQRVVIHGKKDIMGVMGSKPVHIMKSDEKNKPVEMEHFFIDTGFSKNEVEQWVKAGDAITRHNECIEMGNCVNGKSLDNRVSVYVLIETLKLLNNHTFNFDIYAIFTVQEEVGTRGAQVVALEINPNFAIAIDTTIAYDIPGSQSFEQITRLGKGAAIKIMDGSVICDSRMVSFMKTTADKNSIPWQAELLPAGGTDTAYIQQFTKSGSIAGAISIPTRHIHQTVESCHICDIKNAIQLLVACVTDLNSYNWAH